MPDQLESAANEIRPDVTGDWLVTRVEHCIKPRGGYQCHIDAEKPNSDADVEDSTDGDVTDIVRPKVG